MDDEKTEAFSPDEVYDNWDSISKDEKIKFFTDSPSAVIAAFTELLVKAFDKADERVSDLVKSRQEALIRLLEKGDWSIDEVERIFALMDEGIKKEVESKDKSNDTKLRAIGMFGGIASIGAGLYVAIKVNKKAGVAMIVSGTALLGLSGSETKIKALLDSLNDTQNEDAVKA